MPKLTSEQIQEMRRLHTEEGFGSRKLAKMYNISRATAQYWMDINFREKFIKKCSERSKKLYKEGKTWAQKNPEKARVIANEYSRRYYRKSHPKINKVHKNPDEIREYQRNRMREKRKSSEFRAKERGYDKKRWREGKIWKQQNKDKVNEYGRRATAEGRSWQQRHPKETEEYMNNYVKTRYKTDPHFRNIFMIRGNHRYHKDKLITPETKCEVCGSREKLELHHTKYIQGKEGLKYIKILCRDCHRKLHQKK